MNGDRRFDVILRALLAGSQQLEVTWTPEIAPG